MAQLDSYGLRLNSMERPILFLYLTSHLARDCFSKTSKPSYKSPVNNHSSVSKGFQPKFTLKLIQSSTKSNSQADPKFLKDYKAEYKKTKAKLALFEASPSSSQNPKTFQPKNKGLVIETFDWDEEEVFDEDEVTQVKVLMALADDELTVGKSNARNGEWVDITIRKVNTLLFIDEDADWKNYLKYINIDLKFVEEQRLNLLSKILYCMIYKREDHKTSDHEMYIASLKRSKNYKAQPYQYASSSKQILKAKANPFPPCTHYGFNDHRPDDYRNYPECEICRSYDHFTSSHNHVIYIGGGMLAESSQSSKSSIGVKCNTCESTIHPSPTIMSFITSKEVRNSGCKGQGAYQKHNQLCDAKYIVQFDDKQGTIFNANKEIVLIAPRRNDVYVLDMSSLSPNRACFFAKASKSVKWLWHKRLSHLNFKNINKLSKQNKVLGLPSLVYLKDKPCTTCEKGKHHGASFKTKQNLSIRKCLHLLYMDLFGPVSLMSINHEKYTLVIVDEYSRVFNTRRQQIEETYHVTFDESMEAIRFTYTLEDEIGIDDSSRYPPDEFVHEDDPSSQYQSLEVIAINKPDIPHTKDTQGPSDLINTKETHEQNVQNDQMITQPTDVPLGNNNEVSGSITKSLVPDVTQNRISNQASTSSHLFPQDRLSRDQQIKLVNIIGDPGEGMLTRIMATKLTATSASECLFANFLSKIEPKKEEGIDYDETFAPVARIEAIRIFLTFATYMNFKVYQMDVKSAFLNGKLKEEVYVKQSCGFESSEFPDYVCKLKSPLWNETSTKGMSVAMSPAEAKYVAAAGCCASILWMKSQLSDYDIHYKMVPIFYDNTNAITISNNPVFSENYSSTEQVNSIQQLLANCLIIRTEVDMGEIIYSDIITKLLNKSRLKYVSYPRLISCALQVLLGSDYTKDSVSPPPLFAKPKKGKSRTVTPTLPTDLTSMTSYEGTAKTTSRPEGSFRDKDSGGNKLPTDMEPIHPTVADPSGTSAKYQVDQTRFTRLRYQPLTENKGKPLYEEELDTQPLVLSTYADVRAFLLCGDEAQENKPQSSHAPSAEASDTNSSCDDILKKYDKTLPLTERQLVKYLKKVSNVLFSRITEDNWKKHEEAATDKLVEASMSSLDKSNNTISDLYKGFNIITELLKEIKNAVKDDPVINKKISEAIESFTRSPQI
nr:hypothetical protein [Tanacetum cinerariifolium]